MILKFCCALLAIYQAPFVSASHHEDKSLDDSSHATSPRVSTGGSYSGGSSLGSSILHTQGNLSQHPLLAAEAEAQGWSKDNGSYCKPGLGVLYKAPSDEFGRMHTPLAAYYTPAGQIAGLEMAVFGSGGDFGHSMFEGSPALGELSRQGFYKPSPNNEPNVPGNYSEWVMSVSFRSPSEVCSTNILENVIGDRVVINQDTIAFSVPMTAKEARDANYQPGSCMAGMGQHWHHDLVSGAKMSWATGNLMPITPMYYPSNDPDGKLNGIYFSSPACQYDIGANWDNVPTLCSLPTYAFCENFCDSNCTTHFGFKPFHSPVIDRYATYHIFFESKTDYDNAKCPNAPSSPLGPGGAMAYFLGRTCPSNTPTPDGSSLVSLRGAGSVIESSYERVL